MRGDNRHVCIQYKNGEVSRLPRYQADPIVESRKASYINNSTYRGLTREEPEIPKEKSKKKRQHQTRQKQNKRKKNEK